MLNSCSSENHNGLSYFTNAHELWLELEIRYTKSDGPRVFHLKKRLSNIKQGSMTVPQFYAAFKSIWDEYVAHKPVPKCVCGGNSDFIALQQHDSVIDFLSGLHDSYSSIRSQILMQSSLPNLTKVLSILMQEDVRGRYRLLVLIRMLWLWLLRHISLWRFLKMLWLSSQEWVL